MPHPPGESPHHTRRRHPYFQTYPSSALLSILGTIAASSSNVNASPAPPQFLCPSFNPNQTPIASIDPRDLPILARVVSDQSDTLPGVTRSIPDRYDRGSDGMWRRVDKYTLYGSTVCPNCDQIPSGITAVDDEIQGVSSSAVGTSSSSSPSPSYDIRNSLPPGWKQPSNSSASRTTLILVLSLVLAFVICFVIISLVFWRKSKHRKHGQGDVEKKPHRRRRDILADEDRERMVQKEIKTKQKILTRATARWKANIRYTARQRRGKRIVSASRIPSHNSSTTLDQSESRSSSPGPSSSRPLSRRSSMASLHSDPPMDAATDTDPASGQQEPIHPSLASSPALSHRLPRTSPPAYHQRVSIPQNSTSIADVFADVLPSSSSLPGGSSEPIDASLDTDLHLPPIHAAHVATDDKSMLARLAASASSPPTSEVTTETSSLTNQISAPVWRDEEFEDFPCDPSGSSSFHISMSPAPIPLFPPPPSKEKMASAVFYDYPYPYSFEDITLEPGLDGPEAGPSAPPFDDPSSASLTNSIGLAPSAPPLMDTDYYVEFHASAPLHDWRLDDDPPPLHDGVGQEDNHNTEICMIPPGSHPQADVVSDLETCIEGPVSSDRTPPCYHS